MTLLPFIQEYSWTLLVLCGFSLVGGFVLVPFRHTLKYSLFAAPLAGMLVLALGISFCYSILTLPFSVALLTTAIVGSMATLIALIPYYRFPNRTELILLIIAVLAAAWLTYVCNYAAFPPTLHSLIVMNGTDQFGYVQAAEWIKTHLANAHPVASPHLPEQSFLNYLYETDPRFGSFYLLTALSVAHLRASLFTYDAATAVVLIAGLLAVTAVFARSPRTFILLLLSLLISTWFEESRSGFFGKICGYPSIFFIIGLWLTTARPLSLVPVVAISLLTIAASICYPGTSFIVFIWPIAGFFLLYQWAFHDPTVLEKRNENFKNNFAFLTLISFIAIATTGFLAHPASNIGAKIPLETSETLSLLLNIKPLCSFHPLSSLSSQAAAFEIIEISIALLISFILLILSIYKRNAIASSLIGGPTLLFGFFSFTHNPTITWVLYQMAGILFIASQCGTAWLIDGVMLKNANKKHFLIYSLITLMILSIAIRLPAFLNSLHHNAGRKVSLYLTANEMTELTQALRNKTVLVNTSQILLLLPLLVIIQTNTAHDISLQWGASAWHTLFHNYRSWPAPHNKPTHFYLQSSKTPVKKQCIVKLETLNYQLLEC